MNIGHLCFPACTSMKLQMWRSLVFLLCCFLLLLRRDYIRRPEGTSC